MHSFRDLTALLGRLGKLIAFAVVAVGYTLYAGVAVRLKRSRRQRMRATARHQQRGARLLLSLLGVQVQMTGHREQLRKNRPALLVSNHLGVLDPFVLAARLRMALVGKAEIADWPAAGWVARTMGVLFVERGRVGAVETFVERVQRRLRCGVNVLAFPEGTTNGRPQVLPFKTGVFSSVAYQEGEAVQPLYLHVHSVNGKPATGARRQKIVWAGGDESFGTHCWRLLALQEVTVELRVGEPIATDQCGRKELARRAQVQIEDMAVETLRA